MWQYRNTGWRAGCTTLVLPDFHNHHSHTMFDRILSPWRRIGQRWEPTRALIQGPGPKRGIVINDTPSVHLLRDGHNAINPQAKYSPSLLSALKKPIARNLPTDFPEDPEFAMGRSSRHQRLLFR